MFLFSKSEGMQEWATYVIVFIGIYICVLGSFYAQDNRRTCRSDRHWTSIKYEQKIHFPLIETMLNKRILQIGKASKCQQCYKVLFNLMDGVALLHTMIKMSFLYFDWEYVKISFQYLV